MASRPEYCFSRRSTTASRPEVRASLEEERQNIEDQIREVPVLPYLRLGWQFGF